MIEQGTKNALLSALLAVTGRNLTCVKLETIQVDSLAAYTLNPPDGAQYVVIQPVLDGGAGSPQAMIAISECKSTPSSAPIGIVIGLLDIYDVSGNNNINSVTMTAVDASVTHFINVAYYTY